MLQEKDLYYRFLSTLVCTYLVSKEVVVSKIKDFLFSSLEVGGGEGSGLCWVWYFSLKVIAACWGGVVKHIAVIHDSDWSQRVSEASTRTKGCKLSQESYICNQHSMC